MFIDKKEVKNLTQTLGANLIVTISQNVVNKLKNNSELIVNIREKINKLVKYLEKDYYTNEDLHLLFIRFNADNIHEMSYIMSIYEYPTHIENYKHMYIYPYTKEGKIMNKDKIIFAMIGLLSVMSVNENAMYKYVDKIKLWKIFNFILSKAHEIGIYKKIDNEMEIKENIFYNNIV